MSTGQELSGAHDELIDALNQLMSFGFDAMAAYEAAIDRLEDPDDRRQLAALVMGQRQLVDELTACVSLLGGQPRSMGDARMLLTQARVILANVRNERKVFEALRANERGAIDRYESALRVWAARAPERISEALNRGIDDARDRHRWLERHIDRLG